MHVLMAANFKVSRDYLMLIALMEAVGKDPPERGEYLMHKYRAFLRRELWLSRGGDFHTASSSGKGTSAGD